MNSTFKSDFTQNEQGAELFENDDNSSELKFKNQLSSQNQKSCITELLPYDPTTKIKKDLKIGLNEYEMLLNMVLAAIAAYNQGDLEKFDPLVGENACQIRAIKVALLVKNKIVNFAKLENKVRETLDSIKNLLSPKKLACLMRCKISLKELLEKDNLLFFITSDELFLILSYILTETKIPLSSEEMFLFQSQVFSKSQIKDSSKKPCFASSKTEIVFPKNLKKFGNVSSSFTDKIVRKLRKLLSIASVNFIRELASISLDDNLKKMASDDYTTRHLNCFCIPMFWAYKTIFSTIAKEKIQVVIHAKFIKDKEEGGYKTIDEEYLFLENSDLENDLFTIKSNNFSKPDLNEPVFVIHGIVYVDAKKNHCKTEWKKTLSSFSLKKIILAGAADHRQYPDAALDDLIISPLEDIEYQNHKIFATEKGFSLANPSTFFIQHVYPSKIGNFSSFKNLNAN